MQWPTITTAISPPETVIMMHGIKTVLKTNLPGGGTMAARWPTSMVSMGGASRTRGSTGTSGRATTTQ